MIRAIIYWLDTLSVFNFNCYSIERRTALQNTLENQPVIFFGIFAYLPRKAYNKKRATKFKLLINIGSYNHFP